MSTLTNPSARDPAAPRTPFRLPAWTREPLLHFVVAGGLLFAADHYLVGRADDPSTIVVGREADAEALRVFTAARGRAPNAEELRALRLVWLDNEVLYREGLALQLDKGDSAIRERVIFKALSVVDANVKLPPVNEAVLRTWFERNRERYDEPARYDFQEAVLAGEAGEAALRAFVDALNAGAPGEARADLRVFKARPYANLVQSFGDDFAKALAELPPGTWRALPTREGTRVVRLDAATAPKPAAYEPLRSVVRQDWTDAVMAEQRTAAVRELARKYRVKSETGAR